MMPFSGIDDFDDNHMPRNSEEAHYMRENNPFYDPNQDHGFYGEAGNSQGSSSENSDPGDPPTHSYSGAGAAIGDNVVNVLDEVVIGAASENGFSSRAGSAATVGGAAYYGLEKTMANGGRWLGKNGKYYSITWGGNGATASRSGAFKAAGSFKIAGRVAGGFGVGVTFYQYGTGQISGMEASVDAIFGGVAFIPGGGTAVSLVYFGGKALYEYSTGDTLFEKPSTIQP